MNSRNVPNQIIYRLVKKTSSFSWIFCIRTTFQSCIVTLLLTCSLFERSMVKIGSVNVTLPQELGPCLALGNQPYPVEILSQVQIPSRSTYKGENTIQKSNNFEGNLVFFELFLIYRLYCQLTPKFKTFDVLTFKVPIHYEKLSFT